MFSMYSVVGQGSTIHVSDHIIVLLNKIEVGMFFVMHVNMHNTPRIESIPTQSNPSTALAVCMESAQCLTDTQLTNYAMVGPNRLIGFTRLTCHGAPNPLMLLVYR